MHHLLLLSHRTRQLRQWPTCARGWITPARLTRACAVALLLPPLQAAQPPPDSWLYRNVYVDGSMVPLRTVLGDRKVSIYDPSYSS